MPKFVPPRTAYVVGTSIGYSFTLVLIFAAEGLLGCLFLVII